MSSEMTSFESQTESMSESEYQSDSVSRSPLPPSLSDPNLLIQREWYRHWILFIEQVFDMPVANRGNRGYIYIVPVGDPLEKEIEN